MRTDQYVCISNNYASVGSVIGICVCFLIITLDFLLLFVKWWQPIEFIDIVLDLPNNDASIFINKDTTTSPDDKDDDEQEVIINNNLK